MYCHEYEGFLLCNYLKKEFERETCLIHARNFRGRIPHLSIPGRHRGRRETCETRVADAALPPVVLFDLVADGVKVLAQTQLIGHTWPEN